MIELGMGDNWSLSVRQSGLLEITFMSVWQVERWNNIDEDIPSFLLRSNPRRYGKPETDRYGPNKVVTVGLNHVLDIMSGRFLDSGWTAASMYYANWNGAIGAGDSSVAEAAGQTDLQAATNKTRVNLNAGSPISASAGVVTYAADFGNAVAVFAHNEVGLFNNTTGQKMFARKVVNAGTKGATGIWTWTCTLTATSSS